MRWFIILSFFVCTYTLNATRTFLEPEKVEVKEAEFPDKNITERKKMFPQRYLRDHHHQWILHTGGGTGGYWLAGIEQTDTLLNWFDPPAACSLIAYEITNINGYGNAANNDFSMFCASLNPDFWAEDYCEYHSPCPPGDTPIDSILQSLDTLCWGFDSMWTVVTDTLDVPYDINDRKLCAGWVKDWSDSTPNPYIYANGNPPYHSMMRTERGYGAGWYLSYHFFKIRILVSYYENPPPTIWIENLPDTYNQGERKVYIEACDFSVPPDSSGVEEVIVEYSVNGGPMSQVSASLYSGDSTDGVWKALIPGQLPGDTIYYSGISTDYHGVSDTTALNNYIIRQGTPGNLLWVDDDYTEEVYPGFFIKYGSLMDVWDCDAYGSPDSSVIAFYTYSSGCPQKTIVWKGWGSKILGAGERWGTKIMHNDSSFIKQHLENGGRFFLSDQDQGYSFGITPDYGQASVSGWVRNYLGIEGLYDDNPVITGTPKRLFSTDAIYSGLFFGAGNQTPGEIFIAPYYALTGGFSYCYCLSFDSILPSATPSMFTGEGLYVAYRLDGDDGSYHTGKVVNFGFAWEYVANPFDSLIDTVAVDTLFEETMRWLCPLGIEEREDVEPSEVFRLLPVRRPVMEDIILKFFLPEAKIVELSIYDITGRMIEKIIHEKREEGLNSVIWKADVPPGIYFCRLKTGEDSIVEKITVIK